MPPAVQPNMPPTPSILALDPSTQSELDSVVSELRYFVNTLGFRYDTDNNAFKRSITRYKVLTGNDYFPPSSSISQPNQQISSDSLVPAGAFVPQGIDTHLESMPLPLTERVFGSTTLLWEHHNHKDKLNILRYKAPLRNENTYRLDDNTVSYYNTFAERFCYLDNRFDTYLTGFRIIEDGLTESLKEIMQKNIDYSLIPINTFGSKLIITIINNRTDTNIKYEIGIFDSNVSVIQSNNIYSSPIIIEATDDLILNYNIICIRFQAFDKITNNPIGRLIERYYRCIPFDINISGNLTYTQNDIFVSQYKQQYFDNIMSLSIKQKYINGTIKYKINTSDYIPINENSLIKIKDSIDQLSISMFDSNNSKIGSSYNIKCIKDTRISSHLDSSSTPSPSPSPSLPISISNYIDVVPYNSFCIIKEYTQSTVISSIFDIIAPYDVKSVKVSVIVVGGGNPTGGVGGIAYETYYNIPSSYGINVEVGASNQQSSVSFNKKYEVPFVLGNDIGNNIIKAFQYNVYPTIAMPGSNSGKQGLISKGDALKTNNGYSYKNSVYGNTNNQGIVILKIEPI